MGTVRISLEIEFHNSKATTKKLLRIRKHEFTENGFSKLESFKPDLAVLLHMCLTVSSTRHSETSQ